MLRLDVSRVIYANIYDEQIYEDTYEGEEGMRTWSGKRVCQTCATRTTFICYTRAYSLTYKRTRTFPPGCSIVSRNKHDLALSLINLQQRIDLRWQRTNDWTLSFHFFLATKERKSLIEHVRRLYPPQFIVRVNLERRILSAGLKSEPKKLQ